MEEDEEEEGEAKPSIFRIDGTIVPDSPINDLPNSFVKGDLTSCIAPTSYHILLQGDAMIFSFDDLSQVTDKFSKQRMIGKGRFGKVYCGKVRHLEVAVKVLNTVSEFYTI